jgi:uncharacterized RDD family membrane protein YckC
MRFSRRQPELASLGRRLGAGCIDVSCVIGAIAVPMGGALIWSRARHGDAWRVVEHAQQRVTAWGETLGWQRAEPVRSFATAVNRRNWRSPGMYLMHIRRADVRTGGPVTVRSALIRHLAGWGAWRLVSRRLVLPRLLRQQERMRALHADVEAVSRQHPDDPQARQQAIMQIYHDARATPTNCCWMPLVPCVISGLVILSTPRHQSLADWVAGIVVVSD